MVKRSKAIFQFDYEAFRPPSFTSQTAPCYSPHHLTCQNLRFPKWDGMYKNKGVEFSKEKLNKFAQNKQWNTQEVKQDFEEAHLFKKVIPITIFDFSKSFYFC